MRIPLTKYGWPQVVVFPLGIFAAMLIYALIAAHFFPDWAGFTPRGLLVFWPVEFILFAALIWLLTFFRDPHRVAPQDKSILLAPADGRVTDVETVEENDFIGGAALRISIFLSIFDVHINRAPCNVRIEKVTYKKGRYKNAMSSEAGRVNESNDLGLVRTDSPEDRLIVRQISGAIARRVVCVTGQGQKLTGGEKFGMIKFGSRTELYLAARESAKPLIKIGDKVKAGLTPLVRYE